MGSRKPDAERVYAAAALWVGQCLQRDESLFTPGREIWSERWLRELRTRFLDQPDERHGPSYLEKLERQLRGAPPPVVQLMAETLYVHFLIVATQNGATQRQRVEEVLSWSPDSVEIPVELIDGLVPGLAGPGPAFHRQRPWQLAVIIEFAEQWKRLTFAEQEGLLSDPWAFKQFLLAVRPNSRLLAEFPDRGGLQRQALLHLIHPDSFESIVSLRHKQMIVSGFAGSLDGAEEDPDRALAVIRAGLEDGYSGGWLNFYDDRGLRERWDPAVRRRRQHRAASNAPADFGDRKPDDDRPDIKLESGGSLDALATRLHLPFEFLEELVMLLNDKRQIVLQGPPGTGKTFVAQQLARHLAAADRRVTLVQFHPSFAYEDFVQGYRPALVQGQPAFELRNGPLLLAAEAARAEPLAKHVLVIDELNRGNLAKVLGECYFLLEYREHEIQLQYAADSGARFSLPDNLYIIGTMNTADRSIALVDLALRRRFHFVEFHPDRYPVQGLLRRYLEQDGPTQMRWVADIVDLANERLSDDRHAAIGPSHFMKPNLDDQAVERTWAHSVVPYLEERLFGDPERVAEFKLDRLRREAAERATTESDQAPTDDSTGSASDDSE